MSFDPKSFLDELVKAGNLSDEQRKVLEPVVGVEGVVKYLEGSFLRQSDYSRMANELKQKQTELEEEYEEKVADIEALRGQLADSSGLSATRIASLEAQLNKAEADRLKIVQEARSRSGGEEFLKAVGLDNPELKYEPPPSKEPEKKGPEFVPLDRYTANMRAMAEFALDSQAMRDEIEELTGKKLSARELKEKLLTGFTKHKTNDPWEVFAKEFDTEGLKKAKEEQRINALIENARKEAVDQYISQKALPQEQQTFQAGDDPLSKALIEDRKENPATKHDSIVNEAVADFEKAKLATVH